MARNFCCYCGAQIRSRINCHTGSKTHSRKMGQSDSNGHTWLEGALEVNRGQLFTFDYQYKRTYRLSPTGEDVESVDDGGYHEVSYLRVADMIQHPSHITVMEGF